jgi:hypothetical protein
MTVIFDYGYDDPHDDNTAATNVVMHPTVHGSAMIRIAYTNHKNSKHSIDIISIITVADCTDIPAAAASVEDRNMMKLMDSIIFRLPKTHSSSTGCLNSHHAPQ